MSVVPDPCHAPESPVDYKKKIAELEELLQLQELIADISALLIDTPPDQVDEQVEHGLKLMVEFLDLDRSTFCQFSEDGSEAFATHSYARNGVQPYPKSFLRSRFPRFFEIVSRNNVVAIDNIADLPIEATAEKTYFAEIGLKSNLVVPASVGGSMLCAIAFGSFRHYRSWPDPLIEQLKRVGEVFGHAIYRKRAEEKILAEQKKQHLQFQFERLISDLSAQFVNIDPECVDQQIEASLESLIHFFKLDRCALLKVSPDKKQALVTHSWNADGIPAAPIEINYVDHFPWHAEKILANKIVSIDTRDLPEEAFRDRQSAEMMKIRSNLVLPLVVNQSVEYVLAANSVSVERLWNEELVSRIQLLGQIFTNALVRKNTQLDLLKSYDEIKQLRSRLEAEAEYLRAEINVAHHHKEIVGESRAIQELLMLVEQVACTNSTVLIEGETGTGKELVARAIHNLSSRKNRTMVKINCASLPATLIENELFGREKGAYTGAMSRQIGRFEVADHSTIFLDEIGELTPDLQVKLLRVIQEGEFERLGSHQTIKVDVRVIAATNHDLFQAVKQGKFREDLYYRLNVFPIRVPPLRERPKDIPLLVYAFLNEFKEKMGRNIHSIPKQTMETLIRYQWPGNIRELRNVIEHAMIVSTGNVLSVKLPESISAIASIQNFHQMEKNHITSILKKSDWVIKGPHGAAKLLGLKPSTLYSKMKKLGIRKKDDIRT